MRYVLAIFLALIVSTATAEPELLPGGYGMFVPGGPGCPADASDCTVTVTGGTTARTEAVQAAEIPNVTNFGVVCDAQSATGGVATAASTTYGSGFTSADIGKAIQIYGAGTGGVAHATTVANVSGGAAILTVAPVVNASSATSNAYYANRRVAGASANSYAPGDTVTVSGGTGTAAVFTVASTEVGALTVNAGGTGYFAGEILNLTPSDGTQLGQVRAQVLTVSGSAVATVAIVDGGRFLANATAFTMATSGTGGTGVTFTTPKYNVAELTLTTPGVYTATPANPVATTTSGSGTGLTLDIAYNVGGTYAWGTDNAPAFALAIANSDAAPANLRVPIRLPATGYPCGIASPVEINDSFVGFDGMSGTGRTVDGSTPLFASASMMWLGAQNGAMLTFTAVAGPSNYPLFGNSLRGVTFYGNAVAGYGLQFLSAFTFKVEDVGFQDFTIAGLNIDVIGAALASQRCSQTFNVTRIVTQFYKTAGAGIRTSGGTTCNTSYGAIENIQASYKHGHGILSQDGDHVRWAMFQGFRLPGGWAPGIELSCSSVAPTHTSNALIMENMTPHDGGMIIRGLEWCPAPAFAVSLPFYDKSNGSPLPIVGKDVNYLLQMETGDPYGLRKHGEVYYQSAGTASSTTLNTGGSTTASGSYSIVMASVTGYQPGMSFKGVANITDGTIITAVNTGTLTLTLSHPTTGSIAGATAIKAYSGTKLCPEGGGGILINGSMMQVANTCVNAPVNSIAGPQPVASNAYWVYAGYQWARVIDAASSDATRNLVRLTLDKTTGFQTGNQITCYGITGTTEGNSTSYTSYVGNINSATTIDLQGTTFANTFTGGGWCSWQTLQYSRRTHTSTTQIYGPTSGGVQTQVGNNAWTLVGASSFNSDGGNAIIQQASNASIAISTASWFNRKPKKCVATSTVNRSVASTSYGELSSDYRCYFWNWLDPFPASNATPTANISVIYDVTGMVVNDTGGDGCATAVGFDGTTAESGQSGGIAGTVSIPVSVGGAKYAGLTTEDIHYATILAKTITGGTCTYNKDYLAIQVISWQ